MVTIHEEQVTRLGMCIAAMENPKALVLSTYRGVVMSRVVEINLFNMNLMSIIARRGSIAELGKVYTSNRWRLILDEEEVSVEPVPPSEVIKKLQNGIDVTGIISEGLAISSKDTVALKFFPKIEFVPLKERVLLDIIR